MNVKSESLTPTFSEWIGLGRMDLAYQNYRYLKRTEKQARNLKQKIIRYVWASLMVIAPIILLILVILLVFMLLSS